MAHFNISFRQAVMFKFQAGSYVPYRSGKTVPEKRLPLTRSPSFSGKMGTLIMNGAEYEIRKTKIFLNKLMPN
jgi:hypothetical protein